MTAARAPPPGTGRRWRQPLREGAAASFIHMHSAETKRSKAQERNGGRRTARLVCRAGSRASWKDAQPRFQNDKGRSSGTEKDSGESCGPEEQTPGERSRKPQKRRSHGNQAPGGAPHRERRGAGGFGLPARDEGLSAPVWKAHRTDGTDLNETSGDTLLRDRRGRRPGQAA